MEIKLDPLALIDKQVGEVMCMSKVQGCEQLLIVAYESGNIALWDTKARDVLSWLKIDDCPMAIAFDNFWKHGIVGSPNDKLEVKVIIN